MTRCLLCLLMLGTACGTPSPSPSPSSDAASDPAFRSRAFDASAHPDDAAAERGLLELPFDYALPAHLADTVVLTFDDGPDAAGNTAKVLDILRERGAPATFFVNSHNQASGADLQSSDMSRRTLRRIMEEGHELGNHSAHHAELGELDASTVAREFDTVERSVRAALDDPHLRLTLARVPYGRPMYPLQRGSAAFSRVAGVLAERAVHVAWTIDTTDWRDKTPAQIVADVEGHLACGKRGIILMHSIHARTVQALPGVLDVIARHGLRIATCHDYVVARYGAPAAQLIAPRVRLDE